jgi:Ca2+-binding RTX toxin-like protein
MTQTLKLTHEEQAMFYLDNLQEGADVAAAAKPGSINSTNFYFFAAFDGTGNSWGNQQHGNDYATNVWDIWNTYDIAESKDGSNVHGHYEEGPGTDFATPNSGGIPRAVYDDGVKRAESMYAAFRDQALAWIHNPANAGKTFDPQIAEITFSRGDDSTVIFSQLLYQRGLVDTDGTIIKAPGEIKISAAVVYDPVTTGMDENLGFAPIDTNVVALDAKNEYRSNFKSTSYAAQSNIVKEFDFWGCHSDIGGGYAYHRDQLNEPGTPAGQSGTASITELAAVNFLTSCGLPDISMPATPASLVDSLQEKSIEVHREGVSPYVLPWPYYDFGQPIGIPSLWMQREKDTDKVVPASQVNTVFGTATKFELYDQSTVLITSTSNGKYVENDGFAGRTYTSAMALLTDSMYGTVTHVNTTNVIDHYVQIGGKTVVADETTLKYAAKANGVVSVPFTDTRDFITTKINVKDDTTTIGLRAGATDSVLTVTAAEGVDLKTAKVTISIPGDDGSSKATLKGGTASTTDKFTWTGEYGITYKFKPSDGSNKALGTLHISGGALGNETLDIQDFNLSAAQSADGYLGIKFAAQTSLQVKGSNPYKDGQYAKTDDVTASVTGSTAGLQVYASDYTKEGRDAIIKLAGGDPSQFELTNGKQTVHFSGDQAQITLPADMDGSELSLVYTGDPTQAVSVDVTATILNKGVSTDASDVVHLTFNPVGQSTASGAVQANTEGASCGVDPYAKFDPGTGNDYKLTTVYRAPSGGSAGVIATGGDSLVLGGVGANKITSASHDTIYGASGNNTVIGGGTQDVIIFNDGNNQIYRQQGVTSLQDALDNRATVATSGQGDAIAVGNGNNTIVGSSGNDAILLGTGNNTIVCGPGQVSVSGGLEVDQVSRDWFTHNVGENKNVVAFENMYYDVTPFAAPDHYEGAVEELVVDDPNSDIPVGTGNDTIYGGTGNSYYWLPNGNNYLEAGGGNDFIMASTGRSTIFGGSGNDMIFSGGGDNYIDCESGNDTVIGDGGTTTIYGGTGNQQIFTGHADDNWATSEVDSHVYVEAGDGDTEVSGSGGHDTLLGGSGHTTLFGGAGVEYMQAGSGDNTLVGGTGKDTLIGGGGDDLLDGTNNTDELIIEGGVGVDTLLGGSGKTAIWMGDGGVAGHAAYAKAGSGETTIVGGAGTDIIEGGSGKNLLYAGDGGDEDQPTQVKAGSGETTIYGGAGIDQLVAGSGTDSIVAGDGGTADHWTSVFGGSGTDTLVSGAGFDAFYGGSGQDTFVINSSTQGAEIIDAGPDDVIQFEDGVTPGDISASTTTDLTTGSTFTTITNLQGGTLFLLRSDVAQLAFSDGTRVSIPQFKTGNYSTNNVTYSTTGGTVADVPAGQTAPQVFNVLGGNQATVTGGAGNDLIQAGPGFDQLITGSGNDTLVGAGVQTFDVPVSTNYVITANTGTTTIRNTSVADVITLSNVQHASDLTASAVADDDGGLDITLTLANGNPVLVNGQQGLMVDVIALGDGSAVSLQALLAGLTTGPTAMTSSSDIVMADGIQNLTLTGTGNLQAAGNDLSDVIRANDGNDTLYAGRGNATLIGGIGNTTFVANPDSGFVTITNSKAGDVLVVNDGIDESNIVATSTVVGGQAATVLTTDGGPKLTIVGPGLQNVLFANGDTATLAQIESGDYVVGAHQYSNVSVTAQSGVTTLYATGSANVQLTANGLGDNLISNDGNDTLVAGAGDDSLEGGFGHTTYVVNPTAGHSTLIFDNGAGDTLAFGAGVALTDLTASTGTLDGQATVTLTDAHGGAVVIENDGGILDTLAFADGTTSSLALVLAAQAGQTSATASTSVSMPNGLTQLTLTGTGNLRAIGNAGPHTIIANSGNDTLVAGTGLATLVGGSGNDTFVVNSALDQIQMPVNVGANVEQSSVSITLADNVQTLMGMGSADLTLTGNATQSATIIGNNANDRLVAGYGGSTLVSGTGIDTLVGGDYLYVNNALDVIVNTGYSAVAEYTSVSLSGQGARSLIGTGAADLVLTQGNAAYVYGNSGNDTLIGTGGILYAGSGNDTLIMQSGYGGYMTSGNLTGSNSNHTTFVVDPAAVAVTISGGPSDLLQLDASVSLDSLSFTQVGNQIKVTGSNFSATFNDAAPGANGARLQIGSNAPISLEGATNGTYVSGQYEFISSSATAAAGVSSLHLNAPNIAGTANDQDSILFSSPFANDTLVAGSGNDTLHSVGSNTLIGGSGPTTFDVTNGATIEHGKYDDTIILESFNSAQNFNPSNLNFSGKLEVVTLADGTVGVEIVALNQAQTPLLTIVPNGGQMPQYVMFANGTSSSLDSLLEQWDWTDSQARSSDATVTLSPHTLNMELTGAGAQMVVGNTMPNVFRFDTAHTGTDTVVAGTGDAYIDLFTAGTYELRNLKERDLINFTDSTNITATSATTNGVTTVTLTADDGKTVNVIDAPQTVEVFTSDSEHTLAQLLGTAVTVYSSSDVTLPGGITNLTLTGTGNLTATGNALSDVITANSGNDTLIAGLGQATLIGGSGNDTFVVNSGTDVIVEVPNHGYNVEVVTHGSATLAPNVQELVDGGPGGSSLTGNAGPSVLTTTKAGDTLWAGSGITTMNGVNGTAFHINNAADVINITGDVSAPASRVDTTASFTAMPGVSQVYASGANDIQLVGSVTGTELDANSGNDTLVAAGGISILKSITYASNQNPQGTTQHLVGAAGGTTTYLVNNQYAGSPFLQIDIANAQAGDQLVLTGPQATPMVQTVVENGVTDTYLSFGNGMTIEVMGGALDKVTAFGTFTTLAALAQQSPVTTLSASTTLAAGVDNVVLTGSDDLAVTGNADLDMIHANAGNDTLTAGSGAATFIGGPGNDVFVLNNTADVVIVQPSQGVYTIDTSVSYALPDNVQNLTGTGTAAITLTGGHANATITANSGNDTLVAGSGIVTMIGGAGNDTFVINNAADQISVATAKTGNVVQTSVSYTLGANLLNLTGIGWNDLVLTGNNLADKLVANDAFDTLISGTGITTMVGGSGPDLFVVNNSSDVISLANPNADDRVQSSVTYTLASKLQTLTGIGSASIKLTGNTLADVITANAAGDTLVAGTGLATLVGGAGNDTFVINNAADVIQTTAGAGIDTEQTSVSVTLADNITNLTGSGSGALTLRGNSLNGTITANTGADTLIAGSGNQTLTSGSGIDSMVGGAGNDTFIVNNSADAISVATVNAGNAVKTNVSYVLPANLLNLTALGSNAITLTGNALADTLTANSGNDTLISGSGVDTMVGGAGNVTFVVNNSADAISVTTAKTGNVVQSNVDYVLPANLLVLTGVGSNAITLTGNSLADKITANAGNDTLVSGSGIDTLVAGAGNDTFVVNNTSDVVTAGTAKAGNVVQTSVDYTLGANLLNLTAIGNASVKLTGNTLADTLTANSGNDTLTAGTGLATLVGGAGMDTFVINNASDVINALSTAALNTEQSSVSVTAAANVTNLQLTGTTALTATANTLNDYLMGSTTGGADTLVGGSAANVLQAGSGTTLLKDTAGANVMIGGAGADTMTGGSGVAFVACGTGTDAITLGSAASVVSYTAGDGKATVAAGTYLQDTVSLGKGIAYSNLTFSKSGNNLVLNTGGTGSITFTNWYTGSASQDIVTLQVIEQSAATYDANSSNTLYNQKVEEFSFTQLVSAFNAALAATPGMTSWNLSNSLLSAHLAGSGNGAAIGGDLAYFDGMNGNLTGLNMSAAVSTLQGSTFGKGNQTIDPWTSVSAGVNTLH